MSRPTLLKTNLTAIVGLLLAISAHNASMAAIVTEDQIKEKVLAHVQAKLSAMDTEIDQKNVTITIPHVPAAPFDFPAAKTPQAVQITTTSRLGETYSQRGIVQVSLHDDAEHHREIGVPVQITVKKPVWVVKNAISANEPLRASDFSLQSKDISHCLSYAVGEERQLGTYQARVNLRPGEILDARKIVIPPDVRYNSAVRIFISNGDGMTVTVPGIALDSGKIGETIRVRQAVYQRKYYSAKIVDKNRVLVEM